MVCEKEKKNSKLHRILRKHSTVYENWKVEKEDISEIGDYLKNNRIECTKYNYSLEAKVQNFSTFDG